MIRAAEQAAAKSFHVIRDAPFRARGSGPRTLSTSGGVAKFIRCGESLPPLALRRWAGRVVLQFFACSRTARRRVRATREHDKARPSVGKIGADHHERLLAHVVGALGK